MQPTQISPSSPKNVIKAKIEFEQDSIVIERSNINLAFYSSHTVHISQITKY